MTTSPSKNDDPNGCPDTVLGDCEPVCARCGRDMEQAGAGSAPEPGTPVFGVTPGDPFRLEKWAALADDVCMFAGCNATETDVRGPVWLRGEGMAKACTEHWEPIMRIIGEQALWERTDGYRSGVEQ